MGQRRELKGMRVLVTGASQGIGRALAELAARRGCKVLAAARSVDLLKELAEKVRKDNLVMEVVQADVSKPEDRQKMVEAAKEKFGGLDILINNAGIGATGHFADSTPEVLRNIMETNFFGATETTRLFLPILKQGTKPAIVNISSIVGRRALPARGLYSASKFAMQGWSEAIRAELAKDNIDVLVVNPGLTQTNFSKNMLEQKAKIQMDHLRGMTSEQVAEAILRATEKGKNNTNLTFRGKLLLLFTRFAPAVIDFFAKKKVRKLFAEEIAARQAKKNS
ncbi:SDR family oxidoreductase [Telmatocola sphagniphila]|jgi:short-subunit dehydrogenase|uniref:SDR family oxidoreductase n=1 Tax=Telmatocola sphagniphila TaxID=1123043 RepID=A0A8E6B6U1_9BACT|nr:SDR family oxidoreductase [Telmatocola sphagniphila]QVL32953.1 SDR family oxidoreductase [Telmatocola sphagniphila]